MQIGDGYLNNSDLPPERTRIDGQSVIECCHAVHHNGNTTSFNSVSQWLRVTPGRRGVLPAATLQTTTLVADCHGWVVVHSG